MAEACGWQHRRAVRDAGVVCTGQPWHTDNMDTELELSRLHFVHGPHVGVVKIAFWGVFP
jgi:hypothetical protein